MHFRFIDSPGTKGQRLMSVTVTPPYLKVQIDDITKRVDSISKKVNLSLKKTESTVNEGIVLNFWTSSKELFENWRNEFS
jgi:hypothetical protein